MKLSYEVNINIKNAAARFAKVNLDKHEWSVVMPGLKKRVVRLISLIRTSMYPGIFGETPCEIENVGRTSVRYLRMASRLLYRILVDVLPPGDEAKAEEITIEFIKSLPEISDYIETDITAAYEGDPAALSEKEILLAYPAFEAITIYRLAHRLTELAVPLIPRMMTEYAHRITGIDIHPGAQIGKYFFIDHGTGVVIGETCVIGEHVKLYQGVTLGAKSFELDENGNPIKGIKRHPNIGNHVVIYAGATILGGNTFIGDDCIIGGNVWLTHSVEPGQKIFYSNPG